MPSPPEVAEAERTVGLVEVHRESEPKEQGDTDGDVAVAAEVAVDLECVSVDGQEGLQAGGAVGVGEDSVYQAGRQDIGKDHLLEQATKDEAYGAGRVDR